MSQDDSGPLFYVWTSARSPEGPLELPALVSKVKTGTVRPQSWIFAETTNMWQRAESMSELQMFFNRGTPGKPTPAPAGETNHPSLKPGALRRIKIFATMSDEQLNSFLRFVEVLKIPQFATVVRKGDNGDAMYLVLEGELRARSMVDDRESTLATMAPGDSFGEVSLLDHGPRSADVLANRDSTVLKISAAALDQILSDSPGAAAPFLHALGRTTVARLRTMTKKYEDSVHFSRVSGQVEP
jgi:CRP/FNR family cyclic AMP-dependent transcriptional regulator